MARIRVGMIGAGFGRRVQGPGFALHPDYELVALACARRSSAEEAGRELGVAWVGDDWRRMLDEVELDLVSVVTPPALHHEMARRALELGRDLLIEKPTARSCAEVQELLDLARTRKCVHALNHEFRWVPARAYARALVLKGEVGRLLRFEGRMLSDFFRAGAPWRWLCDVASGGGMLGAIGSHMVDFALHVAGPIASVSAQLDVLVPTRSDAQGVERACTADDGFTLMLEFASGASGLLTCSSTVPERRDGFEIHGEKSSLIVESDCLYQVLPGAARTELEIPEAFRLPQAGADPRLAPFVALLDGFAGAIRGRTEFHPDLTDGLQVQQVLDAARRSHSEGIRVATGMPALEAAAARA